ncbi:MAG TPA: arginase [Gammaproteobacteria bacterium]
MSGATKKIALIGAPTDVGAGKRGSSMGPEALRVAGLERSLRRLRHEVTDRRNLAGPKNVERPREDGYRHLEEVATWCALVRDAVASALADGEIPILMGGDHSLAIGSIAAVAEHCARTKRRLTVLWLDAHADFNVPQSSPSGNLHGMPVAVIAGHGPQELTSLCSTVPMVEPSQIIEIGVRSVDEIEKTLVVESGLAVYDMRMIDEHGMRAVMARALDLARKDDSHLHVSFDVDFLDPDIAPGVPTTVRGGPTYREAQLCMEMIYDAGLLGSLDIMELNPAFDDHNRTAALVVELVASLFGEQILARPHGGEGGRL